MPNKSGKVSVYIIAYWHDARFKKKIGGLIRMFELADNLVKSGIKATLILPKIGSPKKQTLAGVIEIPFIDLPFIRPLSFHLMSSMFLLIKMINNIDVLYVRQMNSFLPVMLARLFKIYVFFEIPNDPYLAYQTSGEVKRFLIRSFDKYAMMLANKIVVLSEWSMRRLRKLGDISYHKIIVLPSGTDTELFKPLKKEECCNALALEPSYFYIGFVGSFLSHQGVDTLINAAPKVLERFKKARFLLVGDGPMMNIWKDSVERKGLQEAFIFTGHIPYREVPEYIGVMDICVAPHKKDSNQASPVKLFDYMACGRPVVASDIEAVREITGGTGCAVLILPESSDQLAINILNLIGDEKVRKKMADWGRKHAMAYYDRKKITEYFIEWIKRGIDYANESMD